MKNVEPITRRSQRKKKRSPVGAPPGTLVADPAALPTVLCLTGISPEASRRFENVSVEDIERIRADWPLIWLDCIGLADVRLIERIGEMFGLHRLALEDVVNTGQQPKTDFYDDHAFIVLNMIDGPLTTRHEQIAIFFAGEFVISFQERPGDSYGPVRKRIETSADRVRRRKADYLAYALIDTIVDSYFPVVDGAGEVIEVLEDEVLRATEKHQIRRLHEVRREMLFLKRSLWPLRDALAGLARSDCKFLRDETKIYLRDTQDHAAQLIEIVETYRETLTGLIDMRLSLAQARTGEVINVLTIVSTIFIPLTFLAGVWGMNFDPDSSPFNMPELRAYYGYPVALGFMFVVAVGLATFFRWKKWF